MFIHYLITILVTSAIFGVPGLDTIISYILPFFALTYYYIILRLSTGMAKVELPIKNFDISKSILVNGTNTSGIMFIYSMGHTTIALLCVPWIALTAISSIFHTCVELGLIEIENR